ncbi:ankyrin repeat domain-containing protein [Arthrobacter sp. 18067]|uniref:ankyrin repeat domain-containing protein n=1 Tax=Arthrobacter sp. 18067 TaxID=2681413 RepID=UPI001356E282|nr:ankyrin repeat domain-containing protein [Arthrobacter sp. 18067]
MNSLNGRGLAAGSVIGAGLLIAGLVAGCAPSSSGDPSPSGATASSTTAAASPSSSAAPSTPAALPPKLSSEAQIETDRLLILAAKANDVVKVRELIAAGGSVNAKDDIQDSAFLYAGAEGFNEVLQLTLAAGADVRSTNRYGGTALIPASEHGHTDTVRILIAAGVPVDHVNNLGWTAMQEAILLNNGGPNQQDVVRQLLAAGANPDIRDPQGRTALQNAERLGFMDIAALIRGR